MPPVRQNPPELTYEVSVKHILIVDDDIDLAEAYRQWLQSEGYVVTVVGNGAEALRTILKTDVDAILCDIMMPHMSGDMFYLAVDRARPHLCRRFIFMTGYEGHPALEEFLKKNKAVVLYKPITLGKLRGTLNVLFQKIAADKGKPPAR